MIYALIGAGALLLGYAAWKCIVHEYRDAMLTDFDDEEPLP